jgi:hypothetical protein
MVTYRPQFYFVVLIAFLSSNIQAQIGGDNTYELLNLTPSARIAAMGGDFLTINDNDINLISANPSLLNPEMHNHLGIAYVDFYTDVNYGSASYARTFEKLGSFAASVKYVDYGKFDYADVTGERSGNFYAGETAFDIGWGRQLDSLFAIGANLKFIYSSLESYNSFGMAVDVAGSYFSRNKSFSLSLIGKNIGRQLKAYEGGNIEPLPFELQLGSSIRLLHAPFSFSFLYNHLEKWKLSYDDPADVKTDPITGEVQEETLSDKLAEFSDNLARHVVVGGELYIGKNLSLRGGFNYKRRQEMKVETKTATVGFSWGIGIRISKFHFSYARSAYHLAGSPNYITITTNLSDFIAKKN